MFRVVSLLLLLSLVFSTEVSETNIKAFFEATYDTNKDGEATFKEFVDYFTFMEPEHNVTQQDIIPIHGFFDQDLDKKVTLKELISIAKIKITTKIGPKQIHLGLTNKDGQMQVMWVSSPEFYNQPVVQYGRLPTLMKNEVKATYTTYDVGHLGFHGRIYKAVMTGLQPLKRYFYKVGDAETQLFSNVKYFKAPPVKVQHLDKINIAVFGDMGTFAPFGHFVAHQIARDHFRDPYDFVFLTGDIAYAGMNSEKIGEFEPIWDLFGELTQSFAAYTAFMPGVGNHERYYNYTSYMKRYSLPRISPNQTNLWFSFDYGQVHMVHFSSEHPYVLNSEQYNYLKEDLEKARNNPNIQWIVLGVHRAFYSSLQVEFANITNLAYHLQDLVNEFKVDIVQTGHLHDYQRTWPTYKGKAMKDRTNHTHYMYPEHPVYVVQGTAGALIKGKFIRPAPEWSAKTSEQYGYGKMTITGGHLKYQFIGMLTGRVLDEWNIIKNVSKIEIK